MLTDEGSFVHTHFEAEVDDGDPENGPGMGFCDEFDMYEGESHDMVIDRSGLIVHSQVIDWAIVRFIEESERYYKEQAR
jgi:hypothetical protein